jgi:uncharacterized protein
MKRYVASLLLNWKNEQNRKVLLVRGARQVGKTYSVQQLGRTFEHYLEVNFEEEEEVKHFFDYSLNPSGLCQKLSAYFSIPIIPEKTLLFFDEIQQCPRALSSLRFFHEKMPGLHVIAAGSLLEFAISDIPSQGVGRIQSLYMYSMSFDEFLEALGESQLIEIKQKAGTRNALDSVFHRKLIDYLKIYYIIGGMPEIVKEYVLSKNILSCQKRLLDMIETLKDDFAKYKKRAPVQRLREVFDSIALQSGGKFKYSNIDSSSSHAPLKDALDLIIQAGLAYKVYHTAAQGLPLGAQIRTNRFKVILFDIGIHQKISGLSMADIIAAENVDAINKGNIAEIFAGLEIIKNSNYNIRPQLYYWHKETRASSAEVDYIIQHRDEILPIEVKSGAKGKMQSMRLFMAERNINKGIRLSLENFGEYKGIDIIPLYALSNIL